MTTETEKTAAFVADLIARCGGNRERTAHYMHSQLRIGTRKECRALIDWYVPASTDAAVRS